MQAAVRASRRPPAGVSHQGSIWRCHQHARRPTRSARGSHSTSRSSIRCSLPPYQPCGYVNPDHAAPEGMWCAPSFQLTETPEREVVREAVPGVPGAFHLRGVLGIDEAARIVSLAERMGFVEAEEPTTSEDRQNDALSWALHDSLCNTLSSRVLFALPSTVRTYNGARGDAEVDEMERIEETRRMLMGAGKDSTALIRRADGAPEGMHRLVGLNARCRIYRYAADGKQRFPPHFDDVWPGARVFEQDGKCELGYSGWTYAASKEGKWAWQTGDSVSHLTMLLYLNEGFSDGETALLSSEDEPQGEVLIPPTCGDALCFGQTFRLGRDAVDDSQYAVLHEGLPVTGSHPKYVLRTDVLYELPESS
ncbi:hypothetical protein CYMTET_45475 [Cymbomonas tetramitiformis]|uniref:Fe2OG dioxygenase domain-containing protein n=1 Tax=Cymbomonas tetramitiformis TaxID=36881 RepID=A0AAE0BY58_9CHLO|nr:hypothetical protein CYMTET_45475 [Cymbomonas tetramitiformis]